eukprot:SM000054S18079  [mRNA]  locus=s54:260770:261825:- [translate_table: standard]
MEVCLRDVLLERLVSPLLPVVGPPEEDAGAALAATQEDEQQDPDSKPQPILPDRRQMVDFLFTFSSLLDHPFGSGHMIAAAGGLVIERVRAGLDAMQKPKEQGDSWSQLLQALRDLSRDLDRISESEGELPRPEALMYAKLHCRQVAFLVNSL